MDKQKQKVTSGYCVLKVHQEQLIREAERLGRSSSWVVRRALDEYFSRPEAERDGNKAAVKP